MAADCLAVAADDSVLVVYDPPQATIAAAFVAVAEERGAAARLLANPGIDAAAAASELGAALLGASVSFLATERSLSHTEIRRRASAEGARIASLPQVTAATFERCLAVDLGELEREGRRLAERLSAASECRLTSPAGTDLRLGLESRPGHSEHGDLRAPGSFGNLPAGEAYTAPIETSAEGVVVFDGTVGALGPQAEPIRLEVAAGRIERADGAGGAELLELLDSGGPNGRSVAELGIGTNPAAIDSGRILEAEKAIGTAHLAFGDSISIGGVNSATVHVDGIVRAAAIELDGQALALPS